jgi:hypothetical protein
MKASVFLSLNLEFVSIASLRIFGNDSKKYKFNLGENEEDIKFG